MTSLADDHVACAEVLRRAGSSFALPIRLLPEAKRRGTTALYAFCRRADDVVDDAPDPGTAARGLDDLSAALDAALAGGPVRDPVLRALADTVRRFAVPEETVRDVVAGVRMDLERSTYDTFPELEQYCRRVAGAVGLAAIHIWGFRSPRAMPAAIACGLAFQLTNILRDIPEDLGRGRIYLPREDFRACGVEAADLTAGRIGPGFAQLADRLVTRADAAYAEAEPLDGMLSTDGRPVFRAMVGVYSALHAAVRRAGTAIFTARVRPGRARILAATVATAALGPRFVTRRWPW
jgi:phytoene synthase